MRTMVAFSIPSSPPCAATFAPCSTSIPRPPRSRSATPRCSGFTVPSKANEAAFERAVEDVAAAARTLIASMVTTAPPHDRAIEGSKARARSAARFGARG
jgi:hypothetical protein